MARTITDEEIKLSIIINGNSAQKQLLDLEKSTRKVTEEKKALQIELRRVETALGKDSAEYKKLSAEIKVCTTTIDNNKAAMKELQNQIGITGLTIGQLQSKATQLKLALRNVVPGSEDYNRYEAELKQVSTRLAELSGKAKEAKYSLSSIADGFNKYAALGASFIAMFTGVILSAQKVIDYNGKLSDAQADVMKTTGMTRKEVDELTKSFGALETRTSRIDLLKIAEQGGRIGIAKEEIGSFVEVMNKASVSLGDSFTGGVEEVANKLGKLKFLFQETKDMSVDQAYNSIGSAINDLGANGVASEANIADFATRLGSLTDVLKPTIRETLALGAAFEESGIESEVSARAYNIFMKQASTESAKFAKVMGISQKAVEDMINTNPLDFMLKFAEGMKGMDATETAKTLDFLGVNADGANKVIGAMGNNMGRFRELIDLSNNSFEDGSSLITEYNIKNETLGATLEKISKRITGAFSSETFVKWLSTAVNWFAKFIGAVEDSETEVNAFKVTLVFAAKIFAMLIASLISYNAWLLLVSLTTNKATTAATLANVQRKLSVLWDSLAAAGLLIYTGVMNYFGIATTKATAALTRLNLASKLSPWGAILGLITAIVVAYLAFKDSVNSATVAQDTFSKQQKKLADEVQQTTASTKASLSSLVTVINDTNVSLETRKKAYEQLIKIAPEFTGLIVKEGEQVAGLITIYNDYIKALDQVAYAKGLAKLNERNITKEISDAQAVYNAEKKLAVLRKELIDFDNSNKDDRGFFFMDELIKKRQSVMAAEANLEMAKKSLESTKVIIDETNNFKKSEIESLENSMAARQKQLDALENKYGKEIADKSSRGKQLLLQIAADKKSLEALLGITDTGTPTKSNFNVPGDKEGKKKAEKKDPNSTQEEINKLLLDNNQKYVDALLKQDRQLEDDRIAGMVDGYEKELAIEALRYEREMDDLNSRKIHIDEIAKLDEESAKAKQAGDIKKYEALQQIKNTWIKFNENLDSQVNQIAEGKIKLHNLKIATIAEKASADKIKKQQQTFEREKQKRETAFLQELHELKSLEDAKDILKQSLSNDELSKIKTIQEAKKELKKIHDAEELEIQKKHLLDLVTQLETISTAKSFQGIDIELLTPEMRDNFTKQVEDLKAKIAELNSIIDGTNEKDSEEKAKINEERIAKIISDAQTIVNGLTSVWGAYYDFMNAKENAKLKKEEQNADRKKKTLKRQLDAGYINQAQYNKRVENIDEDLAKRKAELEYRQAKRQKIINIAQAIGGTAIAVINALQTKPFLPMGPIMAGVAGAMGALQLATIISTPLPAKGYEQGLYGDYVKREQDGKVFKSTGTSKMQSGLFNKPRILVGEGPGDMPEMVIDKKAFSQIPPHIKNGLIDSLRGIKGFENGYYNPANMRYEVPAGSAPTQGGSNDEIMKMMMIMISENTAALREIRENGIPAFVSNKDFKSMKNMDEGIENYKKLIKNTKR